MVKSEPYGEKADVWAAGCVLYQMVTLRPPFYSNNMLSLATKIVEAEYEPVENTAFSERVTDIIKRCLTPDPDLRPDVVEVSSRICDLIMKFLDGVATSHTTLEKRAERDRRRAQKYCMESNRLKLTCCRTPQDLDVNNKLPAGQHTQQSETQDRSPSGTNVQAENPPSLSTPDDQSRSRGDVLKPKARPGSAGICVSHRKVRQIDDPNLRLLELLHKLIFITQLPPGPQTSSARRTLERFKKSLFQRESSPFHLKMELSKVLQGSQEVIELWSGSRDWWATVQSGRAETHGELAYSSPQNDITYEQIQVMTEEVLEQNAYYRYSPCF
ncbi:Serine/threonine-protein kinase Nek10 [Bagarius yarrelli]|uniref:Serine/threonine-protein kinase Nek10 n=1 Tax=Bagarius yarrelli TaxID=175774 RepID=A0A556TLW0_BAGYA|nr:Serine/threonine-protein kinase Nek10 [Bagarius yarrelli]